MFSNIRTSKENKEIVTKLTSKFNLGSENVIARIALAYSLEHDEKLDLKDLKDSSGKEYSKSVLMGDNEDVYLGMIALKYKLLHSDSLLVKYLKLHLDYGLNKMKDFEEISEIFKIKF